MSRRKIESAVWAFEKGMLSASLAGSSYLFKAVHEKVDETVIDDLRQLPPEIRHEVLAEIVRAANEDFHWVPRGITGGGTIESTRYSSEIREIHSLLNEVGMLKETT